MVLFHFYPIGRLNLGWIGVDLFFVLSGFLITNILIRDRKKEHFFTHFYMRRAIRIFPLYYAIVLPLAALHLLRGNADPLEALSYPLYFQNILALDGDYLSGLQHTWSLCIEEQFYPFFPVLIYLLPERRAAQVILLLVFAAVAFRYLCAYTGLSIYAQSTLLPSRMDSLLLGALLPATIASSRWTRAELDKLLNLLALAALAAIFVQLYLLGGGESFASRIYDGIVHSGNKSLEQSPHSHLKFTFLAVFFAAVVGKIAYATSRFHPHLLAVLEFKPIKYLGTISYGLYIYHWVIISVVAFIPALSSVPKFALVALTVVVAAVSYAFFEKPLLKLKSRYSHPAG